MMELEVETNRLTSEDDVRCGNVGTWDFLVRGSVRLHWSLFGKPGTCGVGDSVENTLDGSAYLIVAGLAV
jgi:hypothetical protein